MHHLKYVFLFVLLTMANGVHGQSTEVPVSRLNAITCGALPAPLQTDVQILDDSERFVAFKHQFEKELRAKDVILSKSAATIALLDIKTVREFQGAPRDTGIENRPRQQNTGIGQEGAISVQGNIWSNREGSILGGPKAQPEKLSLNQLQISATFNRRTDGSCLWQGEVRHNLQGDEDPDVLTKKLIPLLARAVGKTIRNKALTIQP